MMFYESLEEESLRSGVYSRIGPFTMNVIFRDTLRKRTQFSFSDSDVFDSYEAITAQIGRFLVAYKAYVIVDKVTDQRVHVELAQTLSAIRQQHEHHRHYFL